MTIRRANEIIRAAQLEGFGGRCGRVAIAINHVVFGGKGKSRHSTANSTTSMIHIRVERCRRELSKPGREVSALSATLSALFAKPQTVELADRALGARLARCTTSARRRVRGCGTCRHGTFHVPLLARSKPLPLRRGSRSAS